MITIDNDYMVNERSFDCIANFKRYDNPSNMANIFLKQLSYRLYDYIITNSVKYDKRSQIDEYLQKNEERVEDFKRALAEQALYLITNGDPTLTIPDTRSYSDWLSIRLSPATEDILRNLGMLRRTMSEEEIFYDSSFVKEIYDPTRNW